MKRLLYLLSVSALLFGVGASFNQASADENGIVSYNQKNGNDTNSADHVPAANNPSDVHISHGDSDGFEYKVPGSKTTYYADKDSPLYKQMHSGHGSSSDGGGSSSSHHSGSDEPISSSKMPKLPSSKSKPEHKKTVVTKTTKPKLTKQGKDLALVHKGIGAAGIAVILFGIIYGIYYLINRRRYHRPQHFR